MIKLTIEIDVENHDEVLGDQAGVLGKFANGVFSGLDKVNITDKDELIEKIIMGKMKSELEKELRKNLIEEGIESEVHIKSN